MARKFFPYVRTGSDQPRVDLLPPQDPLFLTTTAGDDTTAAVTAAINAAATDGRWLNLTLHRVQPSGGITEASLAAVCDAVTASGARVLTFDEVAKLSDY